MTLKGREFEKWTAENSKHFAQGIELHVLYDVEVPGAARSVVLGDQVVAFKNRRPGGKRINSYHGRNLRRITVARPDKNRPLIPAANDMTGSALEIAQRYKER